MQQIFNPSEQLLKSIGFNSGLPLILLIPTFGVNGETESSSETGTGFIRLMKGVFLGKYGNGRFTPEHSQHILVDMFNEPLKNAVEYGNNHDPKKYVTFGLWLGEQGALFAWRDEGNFFSKAETKQLFESRTPIPSTRTLNPSGFWTGELLPRSAKDIHVAVEENTLYLTYAL